MRMLSVIGVWLAAQAILLAADVEVYAVLKVQHYEQPGTAAPTALATNGYSFQSFVIALQDNVVTGATVRLPNGTVTPLLPEGGDTWRFEQRFNTSSALDAAYPHSSFFGITYHMTMQTVHDGPRTGSLTYSFFAGGYPSVTPQILNWNAAQQIDHTLDFTLQWNSPGGNVNDIVQILIERNGTNVVFASPTPSTPGSLNGASNSVVIPAYALPAGTNLVGHILLVHVAGLPDTSYAIGAPGLGRETQFPVQTRPAPPPPVLAMLPRTNGQSQLTLTGETNRTYRIEATDGWLGWQTLLTTNPASGRFLFTDSQATNSLHRFYRGRVGN